MKLNQAGTDLIKSFESCRLSVYEDIVGLNTVGWGQRTNLPVGTTITQLQADNMLADHLDEICNQIKHCLEVELNDNQFSAVVSLVYNIGIGNFESSTLLKLLNLQQFQAASEEFKRWDLASGRVVDGLLRRRLAERQLFDS